MKEENYQLWSDTEHVAGQEDQINDDQSRIIQMNMMSYNQRKISSNQTEINQHRRCFHNSQNILEPIFCETCTTQGPSNKTKFVNKLRRIQIPRKESIPNQKKQIKQLKDKIQDLQRQILSLRRNQYSCPSCLNKMPDYYRKKIQNTMILPQQLEMNDAGQYKPKRRHSKESLQFQQIDFHTPLMHTQEMEEKMWIFLGTMLIAMGSKVMDFDGNINNFKILKNSVDNIRKQVEKCQSSIGMEFFCYKQEFKETNYIDGMNFDPFYTQKDNHISKFCLDGISIQSVQDYELLYDFKYNFNIKYEALITIIEYAKNHCSIS